MEKEKEKEKRNSILWEREREREERGTKRLQHFLWPRQDWEKRRVLKEWGRGTAPNLIKKIGFHIPSCLLSGSHLIST